MKKPKTQLKRNRSSALQVPAKLLKNGRPEAAKCFKEEESIYKKLEDIEDVVEMIARHLVRQADAKKKVVPEAV